jgi:hypothetical protein
MLIFINGSSCFPQKKKKKKSLSQSHILLSFPYRHFMFGFLNEQNINNNIGASNKSN